MAERTDFTHIEQGADFTIRPGQYKGPSERTAPAGDTLDVIDANPNYQEPQKPEQEQQQRRFRAEEEQEQKGQDAAQGANIQRGGLLGALGRDVLAQVAAAVLPMRESQQPEQERNSAMPVYNRAESPDIKAQRQQDITEPEREPEPEQQAGQEPPQAAQGQEVPMGLAGLGNVLGEVKDIGNDMNTNGVQHGGQANAAENAKSGTARAQGHEQAQRESSRQNQR